VNIKIALRTRIRFNGQEYASVDEMPADVRQGYERALSMMGGAKHGSLLTIAGKGTSAAAPVGSVTKIVFNGQEYSSVEQMPVDVRQLYSGVMASLESDRNGMSDALETAQSQAGGGTASIPASPTLGGAVQLESTSSRLVIAALVIGALLFASFVFGR
jgi:outer membrane murein-binding lipoprotein Lpp